jgi:hypothetical protein
MDRLIDNVENTTSDDQQMVTSLESEVTKKPFFTKLIPYKKAKALPEHAGRVKWYRRPWMVALLIFSLLLILLTTYASVIGFRTYKKALIVQERARSIATAIELRDLGLAKSELQNTKDALVETHNTYQGVSFLGYIPFFGGYVRDGEHVLLAAGHGLEAADLVIASLEPYADVLGFAGIETKLEFETAEDRIVFLSETVEKLAPEMDQIGSKLQEVSDEIQNIDETRYPKKIRDIELRAQIISAKSSIASVASSLTQFQPFIKLLPDLLGNPEERKYLILFQNDAELRPTGGFMTAYATISVLKGKITAGVSQDIYTLDSAFTQKVPAPDPIKKYLPLVYNWNLRDMNLSPDFKVSMDTFTKYYSQVPGAPEVDAIIAIDTEIPVRILEILGPIGVSGYGGEFSAEPDPRCDGNCPQVIYELENIITRPTYEIREGRKSILGPLMNSMLANMMGSPKAKWAEFFAVFSDSIREKHLLMYFFDEDKQQAVESLGAAGRIVNYEGDYLHINDTNFAGAKSNLFVEQDVEHEVTVADDGSVSTKLTLTYKNPMPGDNCNLEAGQLCLNGLLRDWIRIYVPVGSRLTAARGFEVDLTTGEDLGKTVFDGFFTLAPESVKKLELEYTTPAGTVTGDNYRLLIQQQPGIDPVKHDFVIGNNPAVSIMVDSDQEIILSR